MKYSWIVIVLLLCACASGRSPQQLAEQRLWEHQMLIHISRFKLYPEQALTQRVAGGVVVEFIVDARGNLSRQKVISYSGSKLFIPAGLALISAASPVPAPPPSMLKDGVISVRAPVMYCLVQGVCPEAPVARLSGEK